MGAFWMRSGYAPPGCQGWYHKQTGKFYTDKQRRESGLPQDDFKCKMRTEAGLNLWAQVEDNPEVYQRGLSLCREAVQKFKIRIPNPTAEQLKQLHKALVALYASRDDLKEKDVELEVLRVAMGNFFGGSFNFFPLDLFLSFLLSHSSPRVLLLLCLFQGKSEVPLISFL